MPCHQDFLVPMLQLITQRSYWCVLIHLMLQKLAQYSINQKDMELDVNQ